MDKTKEIVTFLSIIFYFGILSDIVQCDTCVYQTRRGATVFVKNCPEGPNESEAQKTFCCGSGATQSCCDYKTYQYLVTVDSDTLSRIPHMTWILFGSLCGLFIIMGVSWYCWQRKRHDSNTTGTTSSIISSCSRRVRPILINDAQSPPPYDASTHQPPPYNNTEGCGDTEKIIQDKLTDSSPPPYCEV